MPNQGPLAPTPDQSLQLDHRDLVILRILRKEPTRRLESLTSEVGLKIDAIKKRVQRLRRLKLLKRGWIVSGHKQIFPFRYLAHITVHNWSLKEENAKLEDVIRHIVDTAKRNDKVFVEEVYETFGEADLIVELWSESQEDAVKFIVEDVASHFRGIVKTITQPAILWFEKDQPDTKQELTPDFPNEEDVEAFDSRDEDV